MANLKLVFLVMAFAAFVFEAWRTQSLTPAGLALWVASLLF